MAKQTQRIQCLKDWLNEVKPFKGLSKPKEKVNHDVYNPNIKIKGL